jgi:hypothetical protein
MQGLVDVGRMGYSSLAAHSADIHQSEDTLCPSKPLTDAFHPDYASFDEPFLCQNFQTNYTVVPYGNHGTERVKTILKRKRGIKFNQLITTHYKGLNVEKTVIMATGVEVIITNCAGSFSGLDCSRRSIKCA